MSDIRCRVLVVDDNAEMAADAERELTETQADSGVMMDVSVETSFDQGYVRASSEQFDVVVLDVRRDRTMSLPEDTGRGREVFQEIQQQMFVPIVFWTALPQQVEELAAAPLVQILAKEQLEDLPDAVRAAFASGAASTMREIEIEVSTVMREYLWEQLAPNWDEETSKGASGEVARILITRVAQTLEDRDFPELAGNPAHRFVYPPVARRFRPGDLLRRGGEKPEWFAILTPACDLEHDGKAEFALLAHCLPLSIHPKYVKWLGQRSKTNWRPLGDLLAGKLARYEYIPQYREIPDLVADLEFVVAVPVEDLASYDRVASVAAPFGEAFVAKFSQFRGRIGVPDIDMAVVEERLRSDAEVASDAAAALATSTEEAGPSGEVR